MTRFVPYLFWPFVAYVTACAYQKAGLWDAFQVAFIMAVGLPFVVKEMIARTAIAAEVARRKGD